MFRLRASGPSRSLECCRGFPTVTEFPANYFFITFGEPTVQLGVARRCIADFSFFESDWNMSTSPRIQMQRTLRNAVAHVAACLGMFVPSSFIAQASPTPQD